MLPIQVHADKAAAARAVAGEIAGLIRARQGTSKPVVLGLATGSTPVPVYKELIKLHRERGLSFRNVVTFNLDEYVGLGPDHHQSYRRFMQQELFDHIDINVANTHVPSGLVAMDKAPAHCSEYEKMIEAAGGIDLQILGLGRTGHIGFNEPPSAASTRTRVVHLDELTRRDNSVFFGDVESVPHHAISMGVGTILEAHRIVLLAWGESKAAIVRRSLTESPSDNCPASHLQGHRNCEYVLDHAAASRLEAVSASA